jgi:hypothetical protein
MAHAERLVAFRLNSRLPPNEPGCKIQGRRRVVIQLYNSRDGCKQRHSAIRCLALVERISKARFCCECFHGSSDLVDSVIRSVVFSSVVIRYVSDAKASAPAVPMSASTISVASNAQLLRRLKLQLHVLDEPHATTTSIRLGRSLRNRSEADDD